MAAVLGARARSAKVTRTGALSAGILIVFTTMFPATGTTWAESGPLVWDGGGGGPRWQSIAITKGYGEVEIRVEVLNGLLPYRQGSMAYDSGNRLIGGVSFTFLTSTTGGDVAVDLPTGREVRWEFLWDHEDTESTRTTLTLASEPGLYKVLVYAAGSLRDWTATIRGDARVLAEAEGNDTFFYGFRDFEGPLTVEATYAMFGLYVARDARLVKTFRHAFIGEFDPWVPTNFGPYLTTIGYHDIKVHAPNGTFDCGRGYAPCDFGEVAGPDAVGWGPVEFTVTEVSPQVTTPPGFYLAGVDAWLPSA